MAFNAGHTFQTPQMFGAKGDGTTDDTAALQAWLDFWVGTGATAQSAYWPAGTYKITSSLTASAPFGYGFPNLFTDSANNVFLEASGVGNAPALIITGANGGFSLTTWQGITIDGGTAGTNTGIKLNGAYMTLDGWRILNEGVGVRWFNDGTGTATEGVVCLHCQIESSCTTAGRYSVANGGTDSFKMSGFKDCYIQQSASGNVLVIDSGCQPYQAPFDVDILVASSPSAIIQNSNSSASIAPNFIGNIRLEAGGTQVIALGNGSAFYFQGSVNILGINTNPATGSLHNGALVPVAGAMTVTSSGANFYAPANLSGLIAASNSPVSVAVVPGSTPSGIVINMATVDVDLVGAAYDYKARVLVGYNAAGSAITASLTTPGMQPNIDTNTYGAPSMSVSGVAIIFTNSNWPNGFISGSYSVTWSGTPVVQ